MPCGGINPIDRSSDTPLQIGDVRHKLHAVKGGCWFCNHGGCYHFIQEWDSYIHAKCALLYLTLGMVSSGSSFGSEAAIMFSHKHTIVLDFSLEEDPPTKK